MKNTIMYCLLAVPFLMLGQHKQQVQRHSLELNGPSTLSHFSNYDMVEGLEFTDAEVKPLQAFPNPANHTLTIQNANGRSMHAYICTTDGNQYRALDISSHTSKTISTDELKSGIYYLMTEGFRPQKLIILK